MPSTTMLPVIVFGVKRDGRSTREVKIASSSAESSEEAYYRSRTVMEEPVWGSSALCHNAGHGTSGRARRHNSL